MKFGNFLTDFIKDNSNPIFGGNNLNAGIFGPTPSNNRAVFFAVDKFNKKIFLFLFILILSIIIGIIIINFMKSNFEQADENDLISENYSEMGCERENRSFPSGHLPGSYLGLNSATKMNLFPSFYKNSSNNIF